MQVLFLITARGGSKGIPDKNLRQISGISLVGYKAIAARQCRYCTRLIVSTDSEKIQQDAARYGAESPFTRPAELASDTASSSDVVTHAMDWIESNTNDRFDAVMLLEPSSPFTRTEDFERAVEIMIERDANVVVGMREMEVNSTFVGPMESDGRISRIIDQMENLRAMRRQDLPVECTMNGALYLFKWDFFKQHGRIYADRNKTYGYLMDSLYSVEIDRMVDLRWAEFIVAQNLIDMTTWRTSVSMQRAS